MPSFDPAFEFLARIVYTVVVVLIVYGARQAVAKHAFGERRKSIDRVLLKEPRRGRGVALGDRDIRIDRCSELEELVLG